MHGPMMDYPLTLTHFFERTRRLFAKKTLATRLPGGAIFRYTYRDFAERTSRLAAALQALGIGKGDRVGTFAWNSHRHHELYWAVPMLGAVLHTVNIRLSARDLTFIINHAGDSVLFVGASLWPTIAAIRKDLKTVKHYVVMRSTEEAVPPDALEYESLVQDARPLTAWPRLDENDAAGMCYTSGTTGHPKGVVYTHRAIFLHSLAQATVDSVFALSERDVILHVVPMFHVNAWGVPFTATMVGATQIFGGPNPQPRDILELIQAERVTYMGAVPTIWIALKELLDKERYDIAGLRGIVGGSAAPKGLIELFEKKYGVILTSAWGMTETTPVGVISRVKSYMQDLAEEECYAIRNKAGYPSVCVEIRAIDEEGREVPWDGKTMGELQVRGPWVTSGYYEYEGGARQFTEDGWFRTGDVVTIDPEGYVQIMDRTKDLIKSGGEWISSVDMETLLMSHPKVLEAAVIAVPHPHWLERPLACVVPKPEHKGTLTAEELTEFLRSQVAKWWLPDEIVFVETIPKTSVGKFDKKVLREQFKNWTPKE